MKCTIIRERCLHALNSVKAGIAANRYAPDAFLCVYLEVKEGQLSCTTTNGAVRMNVIEPLVGTAEEGECFVFYKQLLESVKAAPKAAALTFHSFSYGVELFYTGNTRPIEGPTIEEYPVEPTIPVCGTTYNKTYASWERTTALSGNPITATDVYTILSLQSQRVRLQSKDFIQAIRALAFVPVKADQAHPERTGIYAEVEGGILSMAAYDGYRLALQSLHTTETQAWERGVLIAAEPLVQISRVLSTETFIDIEVTYSLQQLTSRHGDPTPDADPFERLETLVLRSQGMKATIFPIAGTFPRDYRNAIPPDTQTHATCSVSALKLAIEGLAPYAKEIGSKIRVSFREGEPLQIEVPHQGLPQPARSTVPSQITGPELSLLLDYRQMLDPLKVVQSSECAIGGNTASTAITVRPIDHSTYLYICMPMYP